MKLKRFRVMLAALLLLVSCGKSPPPEVSPSGAPEPVLSPPLSPSISPSAASPSPEASPGAPEVSPSATEDDPLTAAYKNGELVVDAGGNVLNGQPLLEFAAALEAKRDSFSLTVCFLSDNGSDIEAKSAAELSGGKAVWRALSGPGGESLSGNGFELTAETGSGKYSLLLDGLEVLSASYYPTVPDLVAGFWGYTPLARLAPFYTWHEALADGCFVITDKAENIGMLVSFTETFGFDDGSFLRICEEAGDRVVLTDISFNGERACVTRDTTRDSSAENPGINTQVYDDCELTLESVDGGRELRLRDNQTGLEHVLVKAQE